MNNDENKQFPSPGIFNTCIILGTHSSGFFSSCINALAKTREISGLTLGLAALGGAASGGATSGIAAGIIAASAAGIIAVSSLLASSSLL